MGDIKYVKSPTLGSKLYLDEELRKIEASINNLFLALSEDFGMASIESGTWTPVIVGKTTPGVGTYTAQIGLFYKIGRLVCCQFRVSTSAHTGTGSTQVTNLPFKCVNVTNAHFAGGLYSGNNTATVALVLANTTVADIYFYPGAGVVISAAMDYIATICYLTD